MGFTKLDEGILMSSIMAEDSDTFKVWIALLASCREDGIARVSSIGLCSHCFLPLDIVKNSLKILSDYDSESRSTNDEGRRIRRVDGGFEIINYQKYREFTYKESEAKRKYSRYHSPEKSGEIQGLPEDSASASSSSSVYTAEFNSFWNTYPKKVGKGAASKAWSKIKSPLNTLNSIKSALEWQIKSDQWTKDHGQYIPNPSTYLNQSRWLDEPTVQPKPKNYIP